jgi:GNAT superfamily N-acetyltransferase
MTRRDVGMLCNFTLRLRHGREIAQPYRFWGLLGFPPRSEWLQRRALANQISGASRTFVACDSNRVVAYYALASGAISSGRVVGRFRRNMPDPIPVAILGRFAVDLAFQGRGLGRTLFRDAAQRVSFAADAIGIGGIIVHAISEQARSFYLALGFDPSPEDPMTLMVNLADIRSLL